MLPVSVVVLLVAAVAVWAFLELSRHGRLMYAIGSNARAAALAGADVDRYKVLAYVISGVLASVGGILLAARGTPDETAGSLAAFRTGASFLPLGPDGGLPGPVRRHLEETRPPWVRVVGGFLAVPDESLARILAAAGIRF